MNIELSEHFTYRKLLRFTFPSMVMMVLTSVYGVVDGFFISNFIGAEPFAAVNIIMPFLMIFGAVGFMIGTGGSALVAFTLGTGDKKKANEIFQIMCTLSLIFSMGVMLGQDDNFFDKLFTLGWESFLFFLVPSVCSVILVFILTKRFMDDKRKKEKD